MSRLGQILLFVGVVFIILWFVSIRALGVNNLPFTWVLLGLGVLCFIATGIKDYKFFIEMSGQRATKHGLNAGVLVLLVLGILCALNFIGYRHVKKFDYTKEGLHSLSEQSRNILKSLSDELVVKGFYSDKQDGGAGAQQFKDLMEMYGVHSKNLKYESINPVKRPEEAKAYDITTSGSIVLQYKGKKTKIEETTEQAFTNAIIKITRDKNKVMYYITGHGEKDFESSDPDGAQNFKKYLSESSYEVRGLSLIEKTAIPEDADALIIAGPKQAYLDPEIKAIRNYMYKGGKLLLALDPGTKTNLGILAAALGVEFKNNYILDQLGQLVGGGGATAVGYEYSHTSEVTKAFPKSMTIFQLASQLKEAKDKPEAVTVDFLVKSSPASFSKPELRSGQVKFDEGKDEKGPLYIAVSAQGKMKKQNQDIAEAGDFTAIIVGDSDFITNQLVDVQLNHDLAMNMASFLAKDKDLLSIRPKQSESTTVTMTQIQSTILSWTLIVIIPLIIFVAGSVIWFRRRAA